MGFGALDTRTTYLLQEKTVDWERQNGPELSTGIAEGKQELGISINGSAITPECRYATAESPSAPPPPG
ncbi:hypothetical protein [Parasedimentitalea psychrophila]|uniref:Uncharacterized protein n=1 Tax=Parasedimentitalea psychrophila TaxID=2997337 RepID=A0A9Y2P3P7_9RHOB|nr:hypothetical protein [Parasedimentitalea psychrophila]WIY26237.1 hypothetical protein QPJ95_04740 [Parasedimentitalea psychrophila]